MKFVRLLRLAAFKQAVYRAYFFGYYVRYDRDKSLRPYRKHSKVKIVVARIQRRLIFYKPCRFAYLFHIAAGFFYAADILVFGDFRHRLWQNIYARSCGNVIAEYGNIHAVAYIVVIFNKSLLRTFIVVRRYDE